MKSNILPLFYNDISMPPVRLYQQKLFAPFPITYSSETFAPLVKDDRHIRHVHHLLHDDQALLAQLRHYLMTYSTIFSLEQTIRELCENHDCVFNEFVTPDTVHQLQPFLVQSQRHTHPPISINTTTDSNSSRSSLRHNNTHSIQPPVVRLPHALHDNTLLPLYSPAPPIRPPTPIPSLSTTHYRSPLMTHFNPCATCGANTGHFPGCAH